MNRLILFLALISCCVVSQADDGRDCKCAQCGCQAHCHPVCRVICEMKDEKQTCYCCKTDEVCIPGRSCKTGEVCEPNPCCLAHPSQCDCCQECGHQHPILDSLPCCHHDGSTTRAVWEPSCEVKVRERTKLVKYEVSKKVPHYKWVVEYCCDNCCAEEALRKQQSEKQASGQLFPFVPFGYPTQQIATPEPVKTASFVPLNANPSIGKP